jgi:hypothetical protein
MYNRWMNPIVKVLLSCNYTNPNPNSRWISAISQEPNFRAAQTICFFYTECVQGNIGEQIIAVVIIGNII